MQLEFLKHKQQDTVLSADHLVDTQYANFP